MKLCFSTLGCPGWSWNEIFATSKDLGMKGIEVRGVANEMFVPKIKEFSEGRREDTLARLEKAGMEISMLTSGACLGVEQPEQYMEEARAYIDFAPLVGAKYVRVMITSVPYPSEEEDVEQAARLYRELCRYAEGKGVKVLLETSGALADSRVLAQVMQNTGSPAAGVLWDIHHPYRYFGERPEQTYENIGPWVEHLHVKDSVRGAEKVEYRMMGYGDVPVFDTLKLLKEHGYEGYISLEWVKRWCPELQEPGIVFSHYASYMTFLMNQLD